MKQLLSLLVCFGLAIGMVSLTGCGGDDKKGTTVTPAKDAKDAKDKKDKG